MLMRPDNGGIDDAVTKVGVSNQGFEDAMPKANFCPAVEPHKDTVPVAKFRGQETPWRTTTHDPENRINKQPVVLTRDTTITLLTRHKWRDQFPLRICQFSANHDCLPQKSSLESFFH